MTVVLTACFLVHVDGDVDPLVASCVFRGVLGRFPPCFGALRPDRPMQAVVRVDPLGWLMNEQGE